MTYRRKTHVHIMLSSRLLLFFAFAALAAAYPVTDNAPFPRPITTITETDIEDGAPWFKFPLFGNFFGPLTKLFSSFADIGPRIEVDDDKFKVVVNCKDYKKDDLKVKVKGDFILVSGSHEAKHDDHDLFASQFFHTYSLPYNASAKDVTAVLTTDKFLVVIAPINGVDAETEKGKEIDIEVPIVESGEPLEKEDKVEKVDKPEDIPVRASDDIPVQAEEPKVTTEVATTVAEEDDRREPTTASDREEVTIQDIPNEVNEINSNNEVKP